MKAWTDEEIILIVTSYFDMLEKEMTGLPYIKADYRREIIDKLNHRSDSSIEFIYQNISAILEAERLPFISGYLPRGNYQNALKEPVLRFASEKNLLAIDKEEMQQDVYSWTILSPNELIKHLDKSSVKYFGTAIPKDLFYFFGIDQSSNPPKVLKAMLDGVDLSLRVDMDNLSRVRIFWPKQLSEDIEKRFPKQCELLKQGKPLDECEVLMKFTRNTGEPLSISVISLFESPDTFIPEEYSGKFEGRLTEGNYIRRVRSGENRRKAIEKHGLKCFVCGFDFEESYGELGKGFIEIHHLIPLGEASEERLVNPEKDLVPLCANCHRMIHRMGSEMSHDNLKSIWHSQKFK